MQYLNLLLGITPLSGKQHKIKNAEMVVNAIFLFTVFLHIIACIWVLIGFFGDQNSLFSPFDGLEKGWVVTQKEGTLL